MLDHAFRVCGISRIHNDFEVARNEIAAWQTHRKAGFQKLGVKNGVLHMMITKEEYLDAVQIVPIDDQIASAATILPGKPAACALHSKQTSGGESSSPPLVEYL